MRTSKHSQFLISMVTLLVAGCEPSPDKEIKGVQEAHEKETPGLALMSSPGSSLESDAVNREAYFGDLHVHTQFSFDAYIFNIRATPDDAYKFAKGSPIDHPVGYKLQLSGPPLDFVAVTDHGAYLGALAEMDTPGTDLSKTEIAKNMFSSDMSKILPSFRRVTSSIISRSPISEINDEAVTRSTWKRVIDAAERHNDPGKFTTFAGYEFTSMTPSDPADPLGPAGGLHRNVVFRDQAPDHIFSALDSVNPEDLWSWLDRQRDGGIDALAIAHNANLSDGLMFSETTFEGKAFDLEYAQKRMRNEPLVEISQIKGTSETHPDLSPNDEWAGFEIYGDIYGRVKGKVSGSYVREAVVRGLKLEDEKGFNPFNFGFIGSSDSHVAAGPADEDTFWGKLGVIDGTPQSRHSLPPGGAKTWDTGYPADAAKYELWGTAGLAGVWAEENTRAAIFDALRRKEVFATSGPRIKVRVFAGNDFSSEMVDDMDRVAIAYRDGTTMGGELQASQTSPGFLAMAVRDPNSAPLQRLQMIKVWSEQGETREQVYDIACSDNAVPDAKTARCPDNGAKVDMDDCSISGDKGAAEFVTLWHDPDFDPKTRAAYYLRVLENPTCRWSTWDALRAGSPPSPTIPKTLQERAWASPIRVVPAL